MIMSIVGIILALIFFFGFFLPHWNQFDERFERSTKEFDRQFQKGLDGQFGR